MKELQMCTNWAQNKLGHYIVKCILCVISVPESQISIHFANNKANNFKVLIHFKVGAPNRSQVSTPYLFIRCRILQSFSLYGQLFWFNGHFIISAPNDLNITLHYKVLGTPVCSASTPEPQTSLRFTPRKAVFEFQVYFQTSGPNYPKMTLKTRRRL